MLTGHGSEVTLVEMTDQLLPGTDSELVAPPRERVNELFQGVHLETKVTEIDEAGEADEEDETDAHGLENFV